MDRILKNFLKFIYVLLLLNVFILFIFIVGFLYLGRFFSTIFLTGIIIALTLSVSIFAISALVSAIIYTRYSINQKTSNKLLLFLGHTLVKYLLKYIYYIALLFKMNSQSLKIFYIRLNNALLNMSSKKYAPKDILVLLPHCIQNSDCKYRVTTDIKNCINCGKCQIGEIRELAIKTQVTVFVSTGGTAARKKIYDIKPKLILAVACEIDLISGIMDIAHIPIIGFINQRPHGPCYNTNIDLKSFTNRLNFYIT